MGANQGSLVRSSEPSGGETSPFRLLDLPGELVDNEIALSLDLPTRVSFSMTSKTFRNRIWKFKMGEFDNYEFVMACVRLGYVSILKFAEANGCYLDEDCLREAIRNPKNDQMVKFLLPKFPDYIKDVRKGGGLRSYYLFHASKFDDRRGDILDKFYTTDFECAYIVSVYAAINGKYDMALEYKEDAGIWKDPNPLAYYAAAGGYPKVARKLWEKMRDSEKKDKNCYDVMLEGACFGGHKSIAEMALKAGAKVSLNHLFNREVVSNFRFFTLLLEQSGYAQLPQTEKEEFINTLADIVCKYPSPRVVQWLFDQGFTFRMRHLEQFLMPTPVDQSSLRPRANGISITDLSHLPYKGYINRFHSLKIIQSTGMTWPLHPAMDIIRWTSDLEDLKWIMQVGRSTLTDLIDPENDSIYGISSPRFYSLELAKSLLDLGLALHPTWFLVLLKYCSDRFTLLSYAKEKFQPQLKRFLEYISPSVLYSNLLEPLTIPLHPNFYLDRHNWAFTHDEPRGRSESYRYRPTNLVETLRFIYNDLGVKIDSETKAKLLKLVRSKNAAKDLAQLFDF